MHALPLPAPLTICLAVPLVTLPVAVYSPRDVSPEIFGHLPVLSFAYLKRLIGYSDVVLNRRRNAKPAG